MTPALSSLSLAAVSCPPGLTLALGGSREADLPFVEPLPIPLDGRHPETLLAILDYAGIRYASPDSPAAALGMRVFEIARDFGQRTTFERVTFDWDHTLSNYKIFEDVLGVVRTKMRREPPPEKPARTPMVALEVARPFMQEIAWGMAVGFALRQGIRSLKDWELYQPKVGLVTHTWPDRLGVLARHFNRLIPLLEGWFPGSPRLDEKIVKGETRAIIHLHDFLGYSRQLMTRFEIGGFASLSPSEQDEVMAYCEDGKGHYRKPLGALGARGWEVSSLLHLDDSTKVVADLEGHPSPFVRAVHVRQPHSNGDVQEWHKIAVSALWRSREAAAAAAVGRLAWMEWDHATVPAVLAVLGALQAFPFQADLPNPTERTRLPDGVVMTVHETPTTLGEFWEYYVRPTDEAKRHIRGVRDRRGGLAAVRRDYHRAVEVRSLRSPA